MTIPTAIPFYRDDGTKAWQIEVDDATGDLVFKWLNTSGSEHATSPVLRLLASTGALSGSFDVVVDDITVDVATMASALIGGAASGFAHADANEETVGAAAAVNAGITIQSTGLAVFAAGDVADNDAGRFQYDHSGTPQWEVWVEGTQVAAFAAALITITAPTLAAGGVASGMRDLAANAALTLLQSDAGGSVHVHSTDTSTVAATMAGMIYGSRIRVIMRERTSTGSYTFACVYGTAAGTVTLNAQHEGVDLIYFDGAWIAELLLGGATFA